MIKIQRKIERLGNFLADVIRQRRLECDIPPLKVITQMQEPLQNEPESAIADNLENGKGYNDSAPA